MNLPLSSDKPIDVAVFFDEVTEAYLEFYRRVHNLNEKLTTYSAAKISKECTNIRSEQQQLAVLDQEMINILTLVGNEESIDPLLSDYREAFSRVTSACDDLWENLNKLRTTLLQL